MISEKQKKEIAQLKTTKRLSNEKLWTYITAEVIKSSLKQKEILEYIIGNPRIIRNSNLDIWLEAQPLSPKRGKSGKTEGNTKIDFSFGGISLRNNTNSGIEYDNRTDWVCFVEAKLNSDTSNFVSYDPLRNQITRILENLATFQDCNYHFPRSLFFSLLTPRLLQKNSDSRFYGHIFYKYKETFDLIVNDIKKCKLENRNEKKWKYPEDELQERVKTIKFNWVTYEDIFEMVLGISNIDLMDINNRAMLFSKMIKT